MTSNDDQSSGTGSEDVGTVPTSKGNTMEVPRARLSRLKINRFRNVKPGTELRFDDGINVLLGRNGTGKTTLLELICAIVSGDLRAYETEAFDLEFDLFLAQVRLSVSAKNDPGPGEPLAFMIDTETRESAWHHRTTFLRDDRRVQIIDASKGSTLVSDGSEPPVTLPEVPLFKPFLYSKVIGSLHREAEEDHSFAAAGYAHGRIASACLRLDEGLDIFRLMTSDRDLPSLGRPLAMHLFQEVAELDEPMSLSVTKLLSTYSPDPIVEHLFSQREAARIATEIPIGQDVWTTLEILGKAIGAKRIDVTLHLIRRSQGQGKLPSSTFGKPTFWITTHRDGTYTHEQLSYGEKRLLTFLYHAAANPDILVADELVNGLHYEWIQVCLDAIQGQAFLTSQNPLLLDHLPFGSAEEAQRRFILCDRNENREWSWRNMDQGTAEAFFRAYEVGIQHVSEILETKGLW